MGRPLSKKYFGNTNTGDIAGNGVASAAVTTPGSYTTRPTFTFEAPTLPGGVTATGTITSEALSAAVSGTQTAAYQIGQVLSIGSAGATFSVETLTAGAALTTVAVTGTAGQISFDTATLLVGQSITVTGTDTDGTGFVPGIYYVQAKTGTTATLVSTYAAAIAGTGGAISTTVGLGTTTGLTFTSTADAHGVTDAGAVATVVPVARGSYQALVSGAQVSTVTSGGTGARLTVTYRGKEIIITEAGSGYIAAPGIAGYVNQGDVVVGTVVLNSVGNGGIIAYAYTGASREIVDIVKQQSSRRYKVAGAGGTVHSAELVAKSSDAANEMDITAVDSHSNAYWVLKITSRKALIVRKVLGDGEFASNTIVKWTTGAAVENESVTIQNAGVVGEVEEPS